MFTPRLYQSPIERCTNAHCCHIGKRRSVLICLNNSSSMRMRYETDFFFSWKDKLQCLQCSAAPTPSVYGLCSVGLVCWNFASWPNATGFWSIRVQCRFILLNSLAFKDSWSLFHDGIPSILSVEGIPAETTLTDVRFLPPLFFRLLNSKRNFIFQLAYRKKMFLHLGNLCQWLGFQKKVADF